MTTQRIYSNYKIKGNKRTIKRRVQLEEFKCLFYLMDIQVKIDANCVSTEYETILFVKSLIDSRFVERLLFIKSTYYFARADFIILNTENIKSVIIECKSFEDVPYYLNKSKVDALRRHYKDPFFVIKHETTYYWLRVNAIDWSSLPVINEEIAYDVTGYLSTDYDDLSNRILIGLIYP